jgi:arsenate reductase (thioredoxin)
MARVLFVCLHNAGRSQMSQALFARAAAGAHEAASAGTTPGERVHPEVVEVMREIGIDLADRTPRRLTDELAQWADVVVTMGCGDECPYIPGTRYIDWDLPDPKGRPVEEVRALRDEIARRAERLATELGTLFVMRQARGPQWDPARGRREQDGWDEHAAFIDGLVADGRIVLGGPVGEIDGQYVVLVVRAESEDAARAMFDGDPWMGAILVIETVEPWTLWIDRLDAKR